MTDVRKDAARRSRNNYMREWRAKNPEKVKAARDRYWERRAEREENDNTRK